MDARTLSSLEERVPAAVASVAESVVLVTAGARPREGRTGPRPAASGTGVLVHQGGYVVTNRHVVAGAEGLEVHGADGQSGPGRVLGTDPATDLAVIHAPDLTGRPARLGDSASLRVGQLVIAIGNSLALPGGPTASLGVVSALGRPLPGGEYILEGWIQTDAAVNPGNSGGPLATLDGEVVGINTAMVPFAQGVGFSIPINTVKGAFQSLVDHGRVIRPWLGIVGTTVTAPLARRWSLPATDGVAIVEIAPGSPANQVGLRPGDVLTSYGGQAIRSLPDLLRELSRSRVGGRVPVAVRRGRQTITLSLPLAESPELPAQ